MIWGLGVGPVFSISGPAVVTSWTLARKPFSVRRAPALGRLTAFWETRSYSSCSVVWASARDCPSHSSFSSSDQVIVSSPTSHPPLPPLCWTAHPACPLLEHQPKAPVAQLPLPHTISVAGAEWYHRHTVQYCINKLTYLPPCKLPISVLAPDLSTVVVPRLQALVAINCAAWASCKVLPTCRHTWNLHFWWTPQWYPSWVEFKASSRSDTERRLALHCSHRHYSHTSLHGFTSYRFSHKSKTPLFWVIGLIDLCLNDLLHQVLRAGTVDAVHIFHIWFAILECLQFYFRSFNVSHPG